MLKIKRRIGEKGQVVIPKDIRESIGLKEGSTVVFEVREREIVIKPFDAEDWVEDFCSVPRKLRKRVDIKEILGGEYDLP